MSLLKECFGIQAAADGLLSDLQNPALWLVDVFGGRRTVSGEDVGPEAALTLPTYFAAIRNLSEDVGKLPFSVFKRLKPRGKEKMPDHSVTKIMDREANPEMSGQAYREVMVSYALGHGNGIAEIVRNGFGQPIAKFPIHPSRVTMRRDESGNLVYDIKSDDTIVRTSKRDDSIVRLQQEDVFHLHGLGSNGIFGFSIAHIMAESIGLSLAAQKFGAAFFGNGTTVVGVLEHPASLDETAHNNLRNSWNIMHQSSNNAFKPAVLEEGMTWKPISIPPEQAQFLETRSFQVQDMARAFRMPPHKIGHLADAHFNNIEEQNTEYVTDTMMAWLIRWEKEIHRKLFNESEKKRLFAQHNVNGLLRGDIKTRSEFYRSQFNIGALSPNDIRELEDQNDIGPEGDEYFMQLNMSTLKNIVNPPEDVAAEQAKLTQKTPGDMETDENTEENEENEEENEENNPKNKEKEALFEDISAFKPVLLDATQRVIRKEIKAISRVMNKYANNFEAFNKYLDKFYSEQKEFIFTAFKPSITVLLNSQKSLDDFRGIINDHLEASKFRVIDIYRENGSLIEEETIFKTALLSKIENFIINKQGEDNEG